jgi:hypothetical protein
MFSLSLGPRKQFFCHFSSIFLAQSVGNFASNIVKSISEKNSNKICKLFLGNIFKRLSWILDFEGAERRLGPYMYIRVKILIAGPKQSEDIWFGKSKKD